MPEKLSRTYKADRRAAQFMRTGHRKTSNGYEKMEYHFII
jgi:hypothetical protein